MKSYPILETLFRHHLWSNLQLLELCKTLSEEQLQTSIVGVYGTLGDTLQHLVKSERSYFARISTGQPFRPPENEGPLTFEQMAVSLRRTGEGLIEWAPKVQADERVEVQWDNNGIQGPVQVPKAVILTQVINHATEHRSQIMAMLTQLGIQPPDLDSWSYFEVQELKLPMSAP
ncbi:MAG: DinB family protein [Caldilineaceae bacterium]